jgi:ornithine carbamoyltransferase
LTASARRYEGSTAEERGVEVVVVDGATASLNSTPPGGLLRFTKGGRRSEFRALRVTTRVRGFGAVRTRLSNTRQAEAHHRMRNLLSMADLSREDLSGLLKRAAVLKRKVKAHQDTESLRGKVVGLLFEKPSTRTRTSFEVATIRLGGHSLYLPAHELQLSRGEPVKDTARILGGYLDAIVARVYSQELVEELARSSGTSTINALSDLEHPTQIVADLFTIAETKGELKGLKIAYIGDGDNVCNSLLLGSALSGMSISVGCPENYRPNERILKAASELARSSGTEIRVMTDPVEAASGADVLYTDVWVSMGEEAEKERRLRAFRGYQINAKLLKSAKPDVSVMHCLPAHRGLEITDDVIEGPHSIVWLQGENKLYGAAAVLDWSIGSRR